MEKMKRCWKCKQTKSLNDFSKNRTQPDGYSGLCKICKQQYHKDKGYTGWQYRTTKWKGRGDFGVYKFYNNQTQEVYIGKGWLKEREYDHLYKLKHKKHDNPWFQDSFNSYPESWEFIILEKCDMELGLVKERDYIIKEWIKNKEKLLNKKLDLRF